MKTKYASLIKQLERVTAAYNSALSEALNLEEMVSEQSDVIGISGGVSYFGDAFEKNRAIQFGADTFTPFAIDCGSNFSLEHSEEYTRFYCTVFGYRVFSLIDKGSAEEAYLMDMVDRGGRNDTDN
ncbi:MAG TPA: hypothetical protein VL020_05740 [Pseudomonadales bacterium]|nr:hypothetical protein [Pseudomonadales bacterium]